MAVILVQILAEGGPPGVVNLLHDFGKEVGASLVEHPGVPVVSFTGSSETGRFIGRARGERHKRVSLKMGGKNAQIAAADADLDLAIGGRPVGRLRDHGSAMHHDSMHDPFIDRLAGRVRSLRVGDGSRQGVDVGPLVNQATLDKVER